MKANGAARLLSLDILRQPVVLVAFLLCLHLLAVPTPLFAASYNSLAQEFKTLSADSKKSNLRESWEKMQTKFNAFVKANPKNADAPKAAYLAARCIEEIALRTNGSRDFTITAAHYGEVGKNYSETQQGREALYKKAEIEFNKLKDKQAAQNTLKQFLAVSKDDALKKKARELEAKIKAAPEVSPRTARNIPREETNPPSVQTFSEPTLISVKVNAGAKEANVEIDLSSGGGYSWRFIPKAKTSSGQAALVVEAEGFVPKNGITGLRSVGKGPVLHVNITRAKINASGGKTMPSCRVELTLKDDYFTSVNADAGASKIAIKVNSAKRHSASASGRGVAGSMETAHLTQQISPSGSYASSSSSGSHASKAEMLGLTVNSILLDPGHGGKDPGAQTSGISESKLVLKISKLVETRLKKKGFQVSYTRDKDVFISLEKRTETANRRKADLFISIHVNANTDSSVAGLETYYLDKARTKSAERVAARENGVSVANIDDLQVILTDLGLGTKMQESQNLAKDVQKNMERQVKAGGYTLRTNGVRSGPFYVLTGAKMPSILVEVGYCTNKNDAKYLKTDKYLENLADGIVEGIMAYKRRVESSVE